MDFILCTSGVRATVTQGSIRCDVVNTDKALEMLITLTVVQSPPKNREVVWKMP